MLYANAQVPVTVVSAQDHEHDGAQGQVEHQQERDAHRRGEPAAHGPPAVDATEAAVFGRPLILHRRMHGVHLLGQRELVAGVHRRHFGRRDLKVRIHRENFDV